jgi:inner membrane protein
MDIFTQAVLGAGVGYAVLGRRIGGKAAVLGAAGGILPDLDVLFAASEDVAYWAVHRGVSHAFVFGPLMALLLAPLSRWAWDRAADRASSQTARAPVSLTLWWLFWALAIGTHPLLDLMTTYGTQVLAPFDRTPYSFSAISIIDPVYTGLLIAGLVMAFVWRANWARAHRFMLWMLALSTGYIGLSGYQNTVALRQAQAQTPEARQMWAYTTIFTPWLRRVVVDEPMRLRVGFVSTINPQAIRWRDIPKNPEAEALAHAVRESAPGKVFYRFAHGPTYARLIEAGNTRELQISDARFGIPGQSITGFWGLAVPLENGSLKVDEAYRFTVDRAPREGDLLALARAKLGLSQTVF